MSETRNRFEAALNSLVAKLQSDRTLLAAILFGSLAYDEVWDRSDIDLYLITVDDRTAPKGSFCLLEEGVNIHASCVTRSQFKSQIDGGLQGDFISSSFSRSQLLYSHDESIREFYDRVQAVGSRDCELQLLRQANYLLYYMAKAEKWFQVKQDLDYTFVWILRSIDSLASIEVFLARQIPGREVIQQALKLNPDLFHAVYTDLIHGPKTRDAIGGALNRINGVLDERLEQLFRPILEYLAEASGPRSTTEIDTYFRKIHAGSLTFAYEWLADKGVIEKVPVPLRLGEKSRVTVDEAAYYFDGEVNP